MQVVNQSKHTVLAEKVVLADTVFKRLKGFLGRSRLEPGEGLLIRPCASVHTFFMRFPIDVLFIDKNCRVIAARSCLKPFRLTYIYPASWLAIELPAGSIAASRTSCGDTLNLTPQP